MKLLNLVSAITTVTLVGCSAGGMKSADGVSNPIVGTAPMYVSKNIIENAIISKDHTTLVTAVKVCRFASLLSKMALTSQPCIVGKSNSIFRVRRVKSKFIG